MSNVNGTKINTTAEGHKSSPCDMTAGRGILLDWGFLTWYFSLVTLEFVLKICLL